MGKNCDLTVIGHISIDRISVPSGRCETCLGGPPTYAGFSAKLLGVSVSVISKVGFDFRDEFLLRFSRASIATDHIRRCGSPTTKFEIEYLSDWSRRMRLISKCEPIYVKDIPDGFRCKSILVAPICGEVPKSTLLKLLDVDCIRAIDLQGFIRTFSRDGSVELSFWPYDLNLLGGFHIIKASHRELLSALNSVDLLEAIRILRKVGVEIVVITLGGDGAIAAFSDGIWRIPSFPVKTVDPTGCGDAFIGAFLASYLESEDVLRSLAFGGASASFVVESIGSSNLGFRGEVEERASYLLDRAERVSLA